MFSAFKRIVPEISIFHHPTSPPSQKALQLLRSAISGPYPADKPTNPPLDFKLEVIESPPTPDQLSSILSYVSSPTSPTSPSPSPNANVFLSAHPSSQGPGQELGQGQGHNETLASVSKLFSTNPHALKWPIVVDWTSGKASIGDVEGVKGILELVRKKRDGEVGEGEVDQPKGWFS